MRKTKWVECYRGCDIVSVETVTQTLSGRASTFEGYMPDPEPRILKPNTQYSLGQPRSIPEVRKWVDRQIESGSLIEP